MSWLRWFFSAVLAAVAWFLGDWIVQEIRHKAKHKPSTEVACPCCTGTGRRKREDIRKPLEEP